MRVTFSILRGMGGLAIIIGLGFGLGGLYLKTFAERKMK